MNLEDFILTDEICTHYRVEETFILALHEHDLIHLAVVERKYYLPIEQIGEFEKMRRLHYEMNINLEGLEVVKNLLDKVNRLNQEKLRLENRLRLYE
ncbi:MAG TPA: chaperone modulator CbpM [Flavobacteriaceae bacterium]|nr:chaperone modulator CbpM [Flavobacteriaceae bacterium]